MIKRIEVDAFLNYLGEGITKPALILGSDSNRYIMKKQKAKVDGKTITYDCMFLNELLAFQIGKYLEVPIPDAAIAYLDPLLIDNDPEIRFVHKFQEGIHFASQELYSKEENLKENYQQALRMGKPYTVRSWNTFFKNITNKNDIAKIISFDLLVANFDRFGNTGNLLISNEGNQRKVFAIDHGHCFFGPIWTTSKINMFKSASENMEYIDTFINTMLGENINVGGVNGLGEVFRSIESHIDMNDLSQHSFYDVVKRIEKINESVIEEWFNEIPDKWFIEKNLQVSYYKHFVLRQKNLVRILIQRLADRRAFSNYRGGVLEWENERPTGTQ